MIQRHSGTLAGFQFVVPPAKDGRPVVFCNRLPVASNPVVHRPCVDLRALGGDGGFQFRLAVELMVAVAEIIRVVTDGGIRFPGDELLGADDRLLAIELLAPFALDSVGFVADIPALVQLPGVVFADFGLHLDLRLELRKCVLQLLAGNPKELAGADRFFEVVNLGEERFRALVGIFRRLGGFVFSRLAIKNIGGFLVEVFEVVVHQVFSGFRDRAVALFAVGDREFVLDVAGRVTDSAQVAAGGHAVTGRVDDDAGGVALAGDEFRDGCRVGVERVTLECLVSGAASLGCSAMRPNVGDLG